MTVENVEEVSLQLKQISDNSTLFSSYDVGMTMGMLESIVCFVNVSTDAENNMFDTMDNVLDISETVMAQSEAANATSTRFL